MAEEKENNQGLDDAVASDSVTDGAGVVDGGDLGVAEPVVTEAEGKHLQERHKFGHGHVTRSEKHPFAGRAGGKFKKSHKGNGQDFKRGDRNDDLVRVEKKIADLMQCPRDQATKLITEGKVKVNNIVVKDLSLKVSFEDTVHVNNRMIPNKRVPLKVYIFNKPKGYVVTNDDPQGRATIFDIIPARLGRLVTVGRLDFNSEGLMLLTNNGDFARSMELPSTGAERRYRVRVFGECDMDKLRELRNGIEISGMKYGNILVTEEDGHRSEGSNKWLQVTLYEGKNREIRRVMEHFGLQVNRLIRIGYGRYNLGTLPVGCVMEVKPIAPSSGGERHGRHDTRKTFNKDRKPREPRHKNQRAS